MKRLKLTVLIIGFSVCSVLGQHESHMPKSNTKNHDSDTSTMMQKHSGFHAFSLNLPMNMDGSGTGWLPDNSPMYGYMMHYGHWNFMLHGNVFFRYNNQDVTKKGERGADLWDVPNWFMLTGHTRTGKRGLFRFSAMISLDYLTIGNAGYPLLFQTGETYKNEPLVDRQHPHDLFSEMSIAYSYALSEKSDLFLYFGYPGEPALGSVTFMHRPSALFNPDAPLSHHWNDGTHITFGVITLGYRINRFKVEISNFTGREPDEKRYNFDAPRFDSWSGRLSFAPENWAFQVSQAFIKSPEWLHPLENVRRTTASINFNKELSTTNSLFLTALWGLNSAEKNENAVLLEGGYSLNRLALYTRFEWIQKSSEELDLEQPINGDPLNPINAFTLGFNMNAIKLAKTWLVFGSHATLFTADEYLDDLYGKNPIGFEIYLRLTPLKMEMMN
ncbi:MAG TPA: hypothetical protein VHI78_13555 [Bacteroidales bacterium]|jgi:hypothetical protein|nr:hypothetical protein [Bacteroidales bacterium]